MSIKFFSLSAVILLTAVSLNITAAGGRAVADDTPGGGGDNLSYCAAHPLQIISFRGTKDNVLDADGNVEYGIPPVANEEPFNGSIYGISSSSTNYAHDSVDPNGWEGTMLTKLNQPEADEMEAETYWSNNQIPETTINVDGIGDDTQGNGYTAVFINNFSSDNLITSITNGTTAGINTIGTILSQCPNTHFILEGYSQGAVVARNVAEAYASDKGRIPFVYLIADLDRTPDENTGTDAMSYDATGTGIFYNLEAAQDPDLANYLSMIDDSFYADYPANPTSNSSGTSYLLCHKGDPYCDSPSIPGLTTLDYIANIELQGAIHESYLPSLAGTDNYNKYADTVTVSSDDINNPSGSDITAMQPEQQIEADEIHNQIMSAYTQLNPTYGITWNNPTGTQYSSNGLFLAADTQKPSPNTVNLRSRYMVEGGEYTWIYDDGSSPSVGEFTSHTFTSNGYHTIGLVISEPNPVGSATGSTIIAEDHINIYVQGTSLIDQVSYGTSWDWISDTQGEMDFVAYLPATPGGQATVQSVTLQRYVSGSYTPANLWFHYNFSAGGGDWGFNSINDTSNTHEKYLMTFNMSDGTQQTREIHVDNPPALDHPSTEGFNEDSYNLTAASGSSFTHIIKTSNPLPSNPYFYAWITYGSPTYPSWLNVTSLIDSDGNTVFTLTGTPPSSGVYNFSVQLFGPDWSSAHEYQLTVS